jgi:hypothetical protein
MPSRLSSVALAFGLALPLAGCRADRHLVFASEPSGAQVFVDGEFVGRTPFELPFDAYGHRRVALHKPGYRSFTGVLDIEEPWYSAFPLDLFSEILLPFGWKDEHRLEVVLEPRTGEVSQPDFEAVLHRAESLRRAGPAGPNQLPPAPPKAEVDGGP